MCVHITLVSKLKSQVQGEFTISSVCQGYLPKKKENGMGGKVLKKARQWFLNRLPNILQPLGNLVSSCKTDTWNK